MVITIEFGFVKQWLIDKHNVEPRSFEIVPFKILHCSVLFAYPSLCIYTSIFLEENFINMKTYTELIHKVI